MMDFAPTTTKKHSKNKQSVAVKSRMNGAFSKYFIVHLYCVRFCTLNLTNFKVGLLIVFVEN